MEEKDNFRGLGIDGRVKLKRVEILNVEMNWNYVIKCRNTITDCRVPLQVVNKPILSS